MFQLSHAMKHRQKFKLKNNTFTAIERNLICLKIHFIGDSCWIPPLHPSERPSLLRGAVFVRVRKGTHERPCCNQPNPPTICSMISITKNHHRTDNCPGTTIDRHLTAQPVPAPATTSTNFHTTNQTTQIHKR